MGVCVTYLMCKTWMDATISCAGIMRGTTAALEDTQIAGVVRASVSDWWGPWESSVYTGPVHVSSEGSRGFWLGVPSLQTVCELFVSFINHPANLFSHGLTDTEWLLLQWQRRRISLVLAMHPVVRSLWYVYVSYRPDGRPMNILKHTCHMDSFIRWQAERWHILSFCKSVLYSIMSKRPGQHADSQRIQGK